MNESQLLLRVREAAQVCGVATVTWRRWNQSGRIPQGTRIGGVLVWSKLELVSWIESGMPMREKWNAMRANGRKAVR